MLLVGKGPPDSGGISAMLMTLRRHLTEHYRVDLMNLTREGDYVAGVLSLSNLGRTIGDVARLFRLARKFDVVYLHSAFVPAVTIVRAGLLLIVAKSRRARTILHVHGGSLPDWMDSKGKRRLTRFVLSFADAVISVSDGVADALPSDQTKTIYNGVDTDVFTPGSTETRDVPVIIYTGLLTRRKGVTDLVEASRLLQEQSVSHRLVIVGGRPDEGGAEEEEVRAVATGRERFVGPIPHEAMPAYLQDADIFCLPSWFEAMPLSILEAMATGLPIVATRVGQVPDVVTDDFGRLVQPQDPAALASALSEVLRDSDLRDRLGANARASAVRDYSVMTTVSEIVEVIGNVAGQPRMA